MLEWLKLNIVLPQSPFKLAADQAKEAALLALCHRQRGEKEIALAEMYEKQAARLRESATVE